ncbi:phosphatase PAP2 family protein [Arthrobacter sp. zg-Y820]|uniref:phosphatase PAP2 family protein n=1 Tax=unclassified Arthrobacter TaxID=235627 RepID=UPI001E58AD19|nr:MULTISPECIES: phosphatase PAP2 family protein [unclassified Arthrobacter]MCC9195636.1 phosphatase PAP2 family protein [Arthrobacter sp. zg-Y820]MDK1278495.1 phosphatase PAP2 family protein [Arthrobacter sp. zg.Y820]MDK1359900.1 phosphatase PAP2 family protein [Arthrobacter sp. zg-Y1219]WIB09069.1 phosphatase PAP2 family protein [Arthrobacter sp. zg-Y820]
MNTRNLLNSRAPIQRRPAHNAAVFLFGALLCAAAVAVTYWAFVRTTTGQLADESAWREAELVMPGSRVPVLEFLDSLPLLSVFIAGAVVLVTTVRRRRLAPAVVALSTFAAANISSQLLKRFFFDRPDRGVITLDFNSLPSGHTTLAASAAAVVFLLASPRWRPAVAAFGGSYAVLAGAATFINLWHRPADVVASFLVVGTWTLIGGLVLLRTTPDWNYWPAGGKGRGSVPVFAALCSIPGLLALLVAVGSYLYATSGATVLGSSESMLLYFWSGLSLIIGVGYVLSALACWLFSMQAGDRTR